MGDQTLPASLVRHVAADPTSTWHRMLTDPATWLPASCSTSRTRPAYVDSAARLWRRSRGAPALTTPLRTSSPADRWTGSGSPVSAPRQEPSVTACRPRGRPPRPTSSRSPRTTSSTGSPSGRPPADDGRAENVRSAGRARVWRGRRPRSRSCPEASMTVIIAPATGSPTASARQLDHRNPGPVGATATQPTSADRRDETRTVPACQHRSAGRVAPSSHATPPPSRSSEETMKSSSSSCPRRRFTNPCWQRGAGCDRVERPPMPSVPPEPRPAQGPGARCSTGPARRPTWRRPRGRR